MTITRARPFRRALFVCAVLVAVSACAGLDRRGHADGIAARHGFEAAHRRAGGFLLYAQRRYGRPGFPELSVYIEGDGIAWRRLRQLSSDPTPKDPVALSMAVRDPAPNVLYIARPCQYLPKDELKRCAPAYWSQRRYAAEVIAAIDARIDAGVRASGAARVRLTGYSGGGTVAALVAARRRDVARLVTVAGNLDHAVWTTVRDLSPLTGSLNPVDFAPALRGIPQVHLRGADDGVVPREVLDAYVRRLGAGPWLRHATIPGYSHACCWARDWAGLLREHVLPDAR